MKKTLLIMLVIILLLLVKTEFSKELEASQELGAQRFIFKFEPGQDLVYETKIDMAINMNIMLEGRSINTKMNIKMGYNVKLSPKSKVDRNISTVKLKPSGLECYWDVVGPSGKVITKLKDSEIISTQGGRTLIDTKRNIGLSAAKELKNSLSALYLSGEMDINSKGKVVKFRGDVPFVEFWNESIQGQPGFFSIIFPEKIISVGENWKETIVLKKMGEIFLKEPGLSCTVKFIREPDKRIKGKNICKFKLVSPFKHRNLSGYMNQGGQKLKLNISTFDRSCTGSIHFDAERGVLVDSSAKVDATAKMNMSVANQSATLDMKMKIVIGIKLL